MIVAYSAGESLRRADLETDAERVWIEIRASDGFHNLIENYYFPPLFDNVVSTDHFKTLCNIVDFFLNTGYNYMVILTFLVMIGRLERCRM